MMKNQSTLIGVLGVIAVVVAIGWYVMTMNQSSAPDAMDANAVPAVPAGTPPTPSSTLTPPTAVKKTGSVPVGAKTPAPQPSNVILVTYTNAGFSPSLAEVRLGQVVRFQNNSSRPLWVQNLAGTDAAHNSQFDQGRSMKPGEYWDFAFMVQGTWAYQNLNYAQHKAAVAVQPQNY
jgi:hypothetical protein